MTCWDIWHKEWANGKLIPVQSGRSIRVRRKKMSPALLSLERMVGLTAKQLAQETLCAGVTIDYSLVGFVMENRWLRTSKVLTVDASNSRSPIKLASGDPSDPSMWIKRKMDASGVLISMAKWRTLKTFTMVDRNIE
ncbi:hypothetical protein P3T76_003631 [Phytophthora citrophthora]|uniref:Uncharacterized protein n=1 Tax=Phytophthora citrophthora TaxID=4793 RepID=A0AAD9LPN6_9STRA|nr:hypothetical protein P3T76_003631 [Phytophthora citrophthora]